MFTVYAFCNLIGANGGSRKSDPTAKTVYEGSQTLLPWVEGLAYQTTSAAVSHIFLVRVLLHLMTSADSGITSTVSTSVEGTSKGL